MPETAVGWRGFTEWRCLKKRNKLLSKRNCQNETVKAKPTTKSTTIPSFDQNPRGLLPACAGDVDRAGILQVPEPRGRDREPAARRYDDTCRHPRGPAVGVAGLPMAVAVPHLRVLGTMLVRPSAGSPGKAPAW